MIMLKFLPFYILFYLASSCSNYGQLKFIAKLPSELNENSGIVYVQGSESLWFIEDNGNKDKIYEVDFKGNITNELEVKNAKNHDWEDLAKDKIGNIYIGDFGNNNNDRKNLVIYKLPDPSTESGDKIEAQKIRFNYPEQNEFPPGRQEMLFDAEAFFHFDSFLFIVTKNRANPFSGEASIYRVPDEPGNYQAKLMGKIKTCADWNTCQVTSADVSPDGKTIVLLGYGKLWMLTDFVPNDFSKVVLKEIDLGARSQLEAICFKDANTLLLSDEERHSGGRNLYTFHWNP